MSKNDIGNAEGKKSKIIDLEEIMASKNKVSSEPNISLELLLLATKILSGAITEITGIIETQGQHYAFYDNNGIPITAKEFQELLIEKSKLIGTHTIGV